MTGTVESIPSVEAVEDCGRGHACGFCPQETSCQLDKDKHNQAHVEQRLSRINWIIPVLANKGGVGKSTVSANLAVALAKEGYSVGLADGDIHGPNAARLFGLQDERVKVSERGIHAPDYTIEGRGSLKVGSLAYFLEEADTPVVWRDAYKHDYIHHMLGSFDWGVLDFLIVDMPPGTGDVQLTLSQKASVSGAVIVTTPQDIALLDAQKGIEMFRKVNVPILGIVENMAMHVCSQCGHQEHIFGDEGGQRIAGEYGVPLLGSLPLERRIREQTDSGNPTVVADPDSPAASIYLQIADRVATALAEQGSDVVRQFPEIKISDD